MNIYMKRILYISFLLLLFFTGCKQEKPSEYRNQQLSTAEVLPVSGTFINLPYQDVRNKYTNPEFMDCTDPQLWSAKVTEMKEMGMEYLVFMSVANEGKSYYPSKLMPWQYPSWRQSPVDAIMDTAAELGMKVFMSTGWAKDQDDNLRDPKIKARQIQMMEELAQMYGNHPAMYGWYLPVEDCFGPVLSDYAVEAVNALTMRARELTPGKKIMISPYGIFNSDFDNPKYSQQIERLEVDIIAYQDEVGCVREAYPLTRLRENWKKLRAIHDKAGIEMWANCESFAWEKETNSRASALIPAPFSRFLSQQLAASAGGAEKIISFIFCGLFDDPSSPYQLGQPLWSARAYDDYMAWLGGDSYWLTVEASMRGEYGPAATEDPTDSRWVEYGRGIHEIVVPIENGHIDNLLIPMLNCCKDDIIPPSKIFLFSSRDGKKWSLIGIKNTPAYQNTNHDAFIDYVLFSELDLKSNFIKIEFSVESRAMFDKVAINIK